MSPITDADLQAYVDGRLGAERLAQVTAYLTAHPDEAERLNTYRTQQQALQALFKPVLSEPLPAVMRELAQTADQAQLKRSQQADTEASVTPRRPFWPLPYGSLQRIAASVLIASLGGVLGWMAHGRYAPAERLTLRSTLPHQAAVAHVVYSPDVRRPVEISAEHEDQLVTWLSKRLGTPVRPPKLRALGYELIGGRLLPGSTGPVAQFMYGDASGQRLTLYVSTETPGNNETAFRFAQEGPVNVFYWIDKKFGYALSAGIAKDELARIASAVYDQLDRN